MRYETLTYSVVYRYKEYTALWKLSVYIIKHTDNVDLHYAQLANRSCTVANGIIMGKYLYYRPYQRGNVFREGNRWV